MGFFEKLKQGMNKTKASFDEKINNVFSNFRKVDEDFLDELEEILIMSDIGMDTSVKQFKKQNEKRKDRRRRRSKKSFKRRNETNIRSN